MALEVTISASIAFDDGLRTGSLDVESRLLTSADPQFASIIQEIGTSEEVINLGGLASLGAFMLKNLDPTNFINIKTGSGGTIIAKLKPDTNGDGKGGVLLMDCAGSGLTAPWAIADTAECRMAIFAVAQ